MRDRPADFGEPDLLRVLAAGWLIDVALASYAAVGGGSYHWVLHDRDGTQWFATVDDLDSKFWLGDTRTAASAGLRAAMATAVALRHDFGLEFVLAPVPAIDGGAVRSLGARYVVTLFPYVQGTTRAFGEVLPPADRKQLVDMLAALHSASSLASVPPRHQIAVPRRGLLETALRELDQTWHGGPYSEPARELLASAAGHVGHLLSTFDGLAGQLAPREPVVTHGEPHNANLLRTRDRVLLIDWDTVGLAPPERDLWMVMDDEHSEEALLYTSITGRAVDPAALALYRIRWQLDDVAAFVGMFRGAHGKTPDAEHTWRGMSRTLARVL